MTRHGLLLLLLLLSAAPTVAQDDDSDYPLGKLRFPPVTEPAEPVRLVDLSFGVDKEDSSDWSFRPRWKLGAKAFLGAAVRGKQLGAFLETQRLELRMSQEEGLWAFGGAYRASFFRATLDAERRPDDTWNVNGVGSLRLSSDWELLLAYRHDADDSRGAMPSLEDFVETSRLPSPTPATRTIRSGSAGFLFQHDNDLELNGEASVSRVRTGAGFDLTRARAGGDGIWNHSGFEIDGRAFIDRLTGRLSRSEALVELGVAFRFAAHFVATARARQAWQPGVERFIREYRGSMTFFGRRFRFARSSEVAEALLRTTRRVNELGYNERRVYDVAALRSLRERLSISTHREELASDIDALYRAQVRERNVPQLGFELVTAVDELVGSETDSYRMFLGVPWRMAWPFTRGESKVEFIRLEWIWRERRFPSVIVGGKSRAQELSLSIELNREHLLQFRWADAGQTPEQLVYLSPRDQRFTFDYVYALGR